MITRQTPIEKMPRPRPSFAGNSVVVLIGFAIVVAIAAALVPILEHACSLGCPQ